MRQDLARSEPRPLLMSDMQAIMEETQAFENRVLERLNAGKTVRSFLIAAVELLTEAVNIRCWTATGRWATFPYA